MSNTHTHAALRLADLVSEGPPELNAQYGAVLNDAQRHALRAIVGRVITASCTLMPNDC